MLSWFNKKKEIVIDSKDLEKAINEALTIKVGVIVSNFIDANQEVINSHCQEIFKNLDIKTTVYNNLDKIIYSEMSWKYREQVDKIVLAGLSKELLDNYDFKTPIQTHMQSLVTEYLQTTKQKNQYLDYRKY